MSRTGQTELTQNEQALAEMAARLHSSTLAQLFAQDPHRSSTFQETAAGWSFDYSRHLLEGESKELLLQRLRLLDLPNLLEQLFSGADVNTTEERPALHSALRLPPSAMVPVQEKNVVPQVHEVLAQMADWVNRIHTGQWRGATGKRITHIVNLGIGGSHLGPAMAAAALAPWAQADMRVSFVSNVDAADLHDVLRTSDPERTLFIVASKSFSTIETMTNARSARAWIQQALGESSVQQHFVAVSTNHELVRAFGIDPANMFTFWDWVGGRYSFTSAIGLSVMALIGSDHFRDMLAGAHDMDQHTRTSELEHNIPVLHAALTYWYRTYFHAASLAIIPYEQRLRLFPAHLQQLVMESLGKSVTVAGNPVTTPTGGVIWGEPGTNAQHSFFQLLHQGTEFIPMDLILVRNNPHEAPTHQDLLLANALAQSRAFTYGRPAAELEERGVEPTLIPHRVVPGNRVHSLLLTSELTPYTLGSLVALYEHSVFVQAVLMQINPFDQWGVELGKDLADQILTALTEEDPTTAPGWSQLDAGTQQLIEWARQRH